MQRRMNMVKIEKSSGNIYADLGMVDADEMLVKAQLANKISEIIKNKKWTQQKAAKVLGMTQPKLSNMLRGKFRGISEAKMLDCLLKLGRNIEITIGPPRRTHFVGQLAVVFAQ
jgi:predicted XRE-type DNA-binding protein